MVRYAVYYMPSEHSPLWRFGSSILGFDAATSMDVDYPDHAIFKDPAALGWTARPRQYGFHATLKAPFHLAPGASAENLEACAQDFAAERLAFDIELKVATFRDFLALVPVERYAELDRLADDCVRAFEPFRAPLTPVDRERRHPERLTSRELENLDRWGYPFVFEEFRFHMTLTGVLELDEQLRLEPVFRELFDVVPPAVTIDALALFRQDEREGRFRLHQRYPFKAA